MQAESIESSPSPLDKQQQELSRAFASFTHAAGSLERSYAKLQLEVIRLRHELEETNRDLAHSLEQNRRMRDYLNRILEGLPCGVLVVDGAGRVRLANPEAHRLLAIAPGMILPLEPLPPPAERALSCCAGDCAEHECMYASEENGEGWVAIRRASLGDVRDEHAIYILRDISEQKRMASEQERIRRQEALAEMSALLAHEIRNPLGSLELFSGLLANVDHGSEEERGQWIMQLQAGLRTLSATVNNVLHFHSLPPSLLVACDLGEVLDAAFAFLSPLGKQSGVVMQIRNALHGVMRPADGNRLQQVLFNLALNALRFTPSGGRVIFHGRLQAGTDWPTAQMQITDTGCGIRPEHLARIFDAGFSTRTGSPGLGLAVCKQIIDQHGGQIRVTSAPGGGATFTVALPMS